MKATKTQYKGVYSFSYKGYVGKVQREETEYGMGREASLDDGEVVRWDAGMPIFERSQGYLDGKQNFMEHTKREALATMEYHIDNYGRPQA